MHLIILIICLTCFVKSQVIAQTEFSLEPTQSMLMTGKGIGQDATINPYDGQDCYAVIENIGENALSVRVQQEGKLVEEIVIGSEETRRVILLSGSELYLDPNSTGKTRVRISYEAMV